MYAVSSSAGPVLSSGKPDVSRLIHETGPSETSYKGACGMSKFEWSATLPQSTLQLESGDANPSKSAILIAAFHASYKTLFAPQPLVVSSWILYLLLGLGRTEDGSAKQRG